MQKSVDETEKAVRMVNELNLFATNEDIDEIATSDLRFLLKLVSAVLCSYHFPSIRFSIIGLVIDCI